MKLLYLFFFLFVNSQFALAGVTITPEQEAAYKQSLDQPAVSQIREYIDDCLANEPEIGYPCKLTADSEHMGSIQEQGVDKIRGRFMVLRIAPFLSEGDLSVRGDLVTVIFNKPPYWLFGISVVYQGEEKHPVIWGFHLIHTTSEKQQELANNLSVYLNDDSFTK
jgi:hypothetical protein